MQKAETRYSTYDRELLAIYLAVKHFKHHLEGRDFYINTDHKPIIYAFQQKPEKASPRQLRHLLYIAQFTTDIRHVPGAENEVADFLSRICLVNKEAEIIYDEIADEQERDPELAALLQNSEGNSLQLKLLKIPNSSKGVYCDVSTKMARPFTPTKYRSTVMQKLHKLSHPGIRATILLIKQRFVWPDMRREIHNFVQSCLACQRAKIHRHIKAPLAEFLVPSQRFSHININLVGPLPFQEKTVTNSHASIASPVWSKRFQFPISLRRLLRTP